MGRPKKAEAGLRWMTYVLPKRTQEGVLLFHTLTRELKDKTYTDEVRFVLRNIQKPPEHVTGYSIFTTTDCNARCFYCFELGRSRMPMSEETAHKAAAYIADHCGGKPVRLSWFGGEPLFNRKVIDIICRDLQVRNVDYHSTMMSNGYLFDGETVRRAASLWKLRRVQITLDGTENVYNRCNGNVLFRLVRG